MKKILMSLMILIALIGVSCNVGLGTALGGTILMSFDDGVTARSILPTQSMDIATYDINGAHEDGVDTFQELDATGSITITSLQTGEWTIQVDGKNAADDIIGTGSTTTIVNPSSQVTANVSVTPVVGNGTLNIDIDWTVAADDLMDAPGVSSTLLSYSGVSDALVYIADVPTRTANYNGLHAQGYYTLLTQFFDTVDNGDGTFTQTTVAGNAEVVRIAANDTSNGAYSYDGINTGALGDVEIIISPELGDPLVIDLTTPPAEGDILKHGDTFTITASTASTDDIVEYTWYVNAVEYSTGSGTITVDTADWRKPKKHETFFANLAVIGFSNGGIRGGSTFVNYEVVNKK
jgi:hypothetical protein